jgi:hypothetical protein
VTSAVDQEMTLLYGSLDLSNTTDKALDKCQTTIGKAATAYLNTISKVLQKCWDAKINGKHTGECFPAVGGDGKYQSGHRQGRGEDEELDSAGPAAAPTKLCDGTHDISPTTIGFPPSARASRSRTAATTVSGRSPTSTAS